MFILKGSNHKWRPFRSLYEDDSVGFVATEVRTSPHSQLGPVWAASHSHCRRETHHTNFYAILNWKYSRWLQKIYSHVFRWLSFTYCIFFSHQEFLWDFFFFIAGCWPLWSFSTPDLQIQYWRDVADFGSNNAWQESGHWRASLLEQHLLFSKTYGLILDWCRAHRYCGHQRLLDIHFWLRNWTQALMDLKVEGK